jgi:hypothetical protein
LEHTSDIALTNELLRALSRVYELETAEDPRTALETLPEPPEDRSVSNRLLPMEVSNLQPLPEAEALATVRAKLPQRMHQHAEAKTRKVLLVAAPAGIGKSYSGIQFVQERAAKGERWYWAAQNHAMWDDLARQPNFDRELWYHWQPMSGEIDGAPACKYPEAQKKYTDKGYKARNLCWWLCGRAFTDDNGIKQPGYMQSCPFRCQGQKMAPITLIMHQHLFTGLEDGKADGIVIDESFIGLLAREKYVSGAAIQQGTLAVGQLTKTMSALWSEMKGGMRSSKHLSGMALMDEIGDLLPDAATQLEEMATVAEMKGAAKHYRNPPVSTPEDVDKLQSIYMDEFMRVAMVEYGAWRKGMTLWAERMWLGRDGLHYVAPAKLWKQLPKKIIVLDATGKPGFYQNALLRGIDAYLPNVERQGRIYQVAGRIYAKGHALEIKQPTPDDPKPESEASKSTLEFISAAKEIIAQRGYQHPAVICGLNVEKVIQAGLGLTPEDTLHYYKLRGRNDLQGRDCVFLFGTPTPSERAITNIALALKPSMIDPIYKIDEKGHHVPLYVPTLREFRLSADGLAQVQAEMGGGINGVGRTVGFYPDPMLSAIQTQMREAELLQAVYRARLITNAADVWIFSSIPLDVPLDGVFNDPPIAPPGISWKLWLKVRQWHNALPIGTVYGYDEMALALETSPNYLRTLNALELTRAFFEDEECAKKSSNGRPKKQAVKGGFA